jgi:hypothetical protein
MVLVLGLLFLFLVVNLGILALGVGLGFLLHWLMPSVDLGMGILIGVIASGLSIHFLSSLLNYFGAFPTLPILLGGDEDPDRFPLYEIGPPPPTRRKKRK